MQLINLYQDEFRKNEQPLSIRQVGIGTGVIVLVLLGTSLFRYWQLGVSGEEVQQARQQLQQLEKQLAEVKERFKSPEPDAQLTVRLERLQRDINNKQQVLNVLSGKQFGNQHGFVEQVTGLARQRIEGMWLTGLQIKQGGIHLGMQGNALKPELLPQYLQRLANESVFKGTEFTTFLMQRREEAPHWIEFKLQSIEQPYPHPA